MILYLVKMGELTLKKGNREQYERQLRDNIRDRLRGSGAVMNQKQDRLYLKVDETETELTESVLASTIGISSWAKATAGDKTPDTVFKLCVAAARGMVAAGIRRFKIEARRTDKSFPLDSYGIMREAGSAVLAACPELSVDVKRPERIIQVEIREKTYVYAGECPGLRGLPIGTAGRGLLLLSGGIDSPVAGFMMAKRGLRLQAVHFHAYPYTSSEARDKVHALAVILARYSLGIQLTTINFTEIQLHIKRMAIEGWSTLLTRMAMMESADRLAKAGGANCLITGDSLCQVSSQTPENLACTESRTTLPVLRPLIGIDKIDTIAWARRIDTYETSILPYPDCCALFSSPHPVLKAAPETAQRHYQELELDALLDTAYHAAETVYLGFPAPVPPRSAAR